jgi:vesicle coat complex subunit
MKHYLFLIYFLLIVHNGFAQKSTKYLICYYYQQNIYLYFFILDEKDSITFVRRSNNGIEQLSCCQGKLIGGIEHDIKNFFSFEKLFGKDVEKKILDAEKKMFKIIKQLLYIQKRYKVVQLRNITICTCPFKSAIDTGYSNIITEKIKYKKLNKSKQEQIIKYLVDSLLIDALIEKTGKHR